MGLKSHQLHPVSLFHLLLALFYSMSTVDNDFFLHFRRLLHRYHGNFFLSIFVCLCVSVFQVWWVISSQVLTQMDQQDEQGGRMEEIYQQLKSAYWQFRLISLDLCNIRQADQQRDQDGIRDSEAETAGLTENKCWNTLSVWDQKIIIQLSLSYFFRDWNSRTASRWYWDCWLLYG